MADEWWEIPVEDEGCDEMYDDMFASNLWKSTDTYDNETDASPIHQSPCLGLASQRDRSHLKMPPHIIALLKPEDLRRLKYQKESCKASTVNSERITITIGYNKNQATDLAAGDNHFRNGTDVGKSEETNGVGQIDRRNPFAWLTHMVSQQKIANNKKRTVPSAYNDIKVDEDINGGRFFSSQVKKLPVADKVNSWLLSDSNCSDAESTAREFRPSTTRTAIQSGREDNCNGLSLSSVPVSSANKLDNTHMETNANCKLTNVRRDDVVPAIPCIVPNIPVCSPTTEQKENENDEGANTPSTNLSPIASALHPDKMKINTECDKKQNVTESTDVLDAVPNTKKSKLPSSRTDLRLDDLALQPNNTTKFQCQSSSGSSSPAPFVNNARRPSINSAIVPMHYVQPNASTMYMMPPPTVMPLPFCPEMHPNPTTKMVAPPGFSAVCGPPLHIGHWPSNSAGPYLNPNAAPFMHNFNRYPMPNMAIGRQGPLTNQVPPNTATITELKHDTGVVVENAKHVIMFDNLPLTIDETELRKKLEGFGKIAHVQVIKKGTSCTAFARVTDLSMAVWIVSTLDESLVDGLPMRVWIKK